MNRAVAVSVAGVVLVAAGWVLLSSACASFGIPTARDAEEASAVWRSVEASGAVPPHGDVAWKGARGFRPLLVYGIEDAAKQEAILAAARDARARLSSLPVRVTFHRARVVHDGHGGATFPDGATVIRTVTID